MSLFDNDEARYLRPPRQYAQGYFAAGNDKEKQRAALQGCPKEWQELVKTHIKIKRERMK